MNLPKIETLLLQEMEEVKGGKAGTCTCVSGAGQGIDNDGNCLCKSGAAQISLKEPDPDEGASCGCTRGAGQ